MRIRHFRRVFIVRWLASLHFALRDRARVHPEALIDGNWKSMELGRGTKIGRDTIITLAPEARLFVGPAVWISHGVEIETAAMISVGAGTSIQRRATINGSVKIGEGCILAPNVFISSGTHPFREIPELTIREQERFIREKEGSLDSLDSPIEIGPDCWLGINVVVCPGVRIGKGVVIGANSVVTSDVEDFSVVAGMPARKIGSRF
ncbi:acetyltransferase (isoleucine patch superfamily)-like protein [Alcanivorax nanhaiticus]|uniref:Acetyltransferase (Isoleucine patch superfamily)-like protein n=2 Tax=Alcanivorax nanhaiticus TaxID=1177154 RepID=A0A095SGH9_9GAMM|nr:acetyltransferase (isoleucine patch superfamily)-like protein [Alcanivorax nanhaiticus]